MQQWTDIRRRVLVEGASKRSICREYGIAFETLQKILRHAEPPGYRLILPRAKTKLGPYLPVISAILLADRDAPPKQRHTAKRIFERLRDEHGYRGGITQVKEAVARYRRHHAEVFVPLSHPPGEAQFDFGFATVKIAGIERKAACAVMCLPYSDAFLFRHRFCTVGRGNEKGVVEGLVGYSRRNFMVPVPEAPSFAELNDRLRERCRADLDRRLWGEENTKATLLEEDRSAMLPIPEGSFEPRRIVQARSTSLSLVRFDRNNYSVPTAFAHHEL